MIDTLSFHFRQPTLELSTRKRIMDMYVLTGDNTDRRIKQTIGKAATVRGCAVSWDELASS